MSKELDALEKLRQNNKDDAHMFDDELLDIIETALKNYEEGLYHAKTYVKHTSKQALYDLLGLAIKNVDKSFWKLPEQLFDDVNISLKALEIIKSADFSLEFDESQNEWFLHIVAKGSGIKTYDLLKEVLLWQVGKQLVN